MLIREPSSMIWRIYEQVQGEGVLMRGFVEAHDGDGLLEIFGLKQGRCNMNILQQKMQMNSNLDNLVNYRVIPLVMTMKQDH
ncbi:hypothetical protein CFP56_006659 [Quercus suber]|uniref:Uncharacterized protein n=1 Tax=Quercus suber TaxID=58331 RepID=A0AAW0L7T4_QUESU